MSPLAVLEPGGDLATALYIVSFSLFILGVRQGTHPTTAKRGNLVAALGMALGKKACSAVAGVFSVMARKRSMVAQCRHVERSLYSFYPSSHGHVGMRLTQRAT